MISVPKLLCYDNKLIQQVNKMYLLNTQSFAKKIHLFILRPSSYGQHLNVNCSVIFSSIIYEEAVVETEFWHV